VISAVGHLLQRARRRLSREWGVAPRRVAGVRFYAQGLEDLYLRRVFASGAPGFYVDVGAHDGCFISNTCALYQDGWRGICIEPNPVAYEALRRQRPRDICLNIGVGRREAERALRWRDNLTEGSSFAPRVGSTAAYTVSVEPLNDILKGHSVSPEFELLSVDVEGLELEVLSTLDWAIYHPHVVIVEYNTQGAVVLESLDFLRPCGYKPIMINRWNIMFSRTAEVDILKIHRHQEWYSLDRLRL